MERIDCRNNKESRKLPGALSTDSYFGVLRSVYYNGICQHESVAGIVNVSRLVENEFESDYENDIFVGKNGAVAAAYNFSHISDSRREREMVKIIMEKHSEFSDYDFEFVKGEFPINVIAGNYYDTPVMSTHILLIKDYKKHLINPKVKSL